jgi:hypothetical protein
MKLAGSQFRVFHPHWPRTLKALAALEVIKGLQRRSAPTKKEDGAEFD